MSPLGWRACTSSLVLREAPLPGLVLVVLDVGPAEDGEDDRGDPLVGGAFLGGPVAK